MSTCFSPISIQLPDAKKSNERISVPCGTCYNCRKNYRNSWNFRINQELMDSHTAWFITLTYSVYPKIEECVTDLQLCFKLLRHKSKFRYYAVLERGENNKRPHWHVLFFNLSKDGVIKLNECWKRDGKQLGLIHVGQVNPLTISYVLKDMTKFNKSYKYEEENIRLMSTKPPIGERFKRYSIHNKKWKNPFVSINGSKIIMPRIYKDKVFNIKEKEKIQEDLIKYADKKSVAWYRSEIRKGNKHPYSLMYQEQLEIYRQEEKKLKKRKL